MSVFLSVLCWIRLNWWAVLLRHPTEIEAPRIGYGVDTQRGRASGGECGYLWVDRYKEQMPLINCTRSVVHHIVVVSTFLFNLRRFSLSLLWKQKCGNQAWSCIASAKTAGGGDDTFQPRLGWEWRRQTCSQSFFIINLVLGQWLSSLFCTLFHLRLLE